MRSPVVSVVNGVFDTVPLGMASRMGLAERRNGKSKTQISPITRIAPAASPAPSPPVGLRSCWERPPGRYGSLPSGCSQRKFTIVGGGLSGLRAARGDPRNRRNLERQEVSSFS